MKRLPFREYHLLEILNDYSSQHLPIDVYLKNYFRSHKQIGSNDRREIALKTYGLIRWQGLLDHLSEKPCSWEKRLKAFENFEPEHFLSDSKIPLFVRLSFPKFYFDRIVADHGEEIARDFCKVSNERAPVTVRCNPIKIDREALFQKWSSDFSIKRCEQSELGITFLENTHCFALPEFKEGLFEMQDEGSQLIAKLVEAKPHEHVLDYCAGSGGKTLAFAHLLEGKGQLYVHDIRNRALYEAKKRLARAGIQNVQYFNSEEKRLKRFKNKMDWVLVDAPCSGSGTLRRNPDIKWKTKAETFTSLEKDQDAIFEKALSYVKPGGKIIYATCSIFHSENEHQVAKFQKKHDLLLEKTEKWLPKKGGMDGFFGAVLQKK